MANVPLQPMSWGRIAAAKKQPDGRWRAVGRYKTKTGKLVQRVRHGATARKAEASLLECFQTMAAEDAAGKMALGATTKISAVIEEWILYIEAGGGGMRISTAYEYARMARQDIAPALGSMRVGDIDVRACADFLHGIIEGGRFYAKAEHNRAVLSNLLTWCTGRGLIPGNPVKQVATLPRAAKQEIKIIEQQDLGAVLAAVRAYDEARSRQARSGPRPKQDIPDGVELLMSTGVRISELLGLRWQDVRIDDPERGFWVQVNGKVGWEKGKGMLRHEYTKTGTRISDLPISARVAAMLRRRRTEQTKANPLGAVFPARGGGWMQQANWRRKWREVRAELNLEYDVPEDIGGEARSSVPVVAITPHTFRRSVGTLIGEQVSLEAAAKQLGHSRTATTIRSYIKERRTAPDSSNLLDGVMYKD